MKLPTAKNGVGGQNMGKKFPQHYAIKNNPFGWTGLYTLWKLSRGHRRGFRTKDGESIVRGIPVSSARDGYSHQLRI